MEYKFTITEAIILIIVLAIAICGFFLGSAALFMLAYNFVVPGIFHFGPKLTFIQAVIVWFLLGFIGACFKSNISKG